MKIAKILTSVVLLLAVAAIAMHYWLVKPREYIDTTPLPQGPIVAPSLPPVDSISSLRVKIQIKLDKIASALNRTLPYKYQFAIQQGGGTLTRSDFEFYRVENQRIGMNGKAWFQGYIDIPWWTSIRAAEASINGSSLGFQVNENWEFKIQPQVNARLLNVDVPLAPDAAVVWLANSFFVPGFASQANQIQLPAIKPFVEQAWNDYSQVIPVAPQTTVGYRPVDAMLGGPVLDDTSKSIIMNLGLDMNTWCAFGLPSSAGQTPAKVALPALKTLPLEQYSSYARVPVVASIKELSRLFPPQTIALQDGQVRFDSLDLSDKDGVLHARINAQITPPTQTRMFAPESCRATLVMQGIPECDRETGEIRIKDLRFTAASDSILANVLGKGATTAIEGKAGEILPILSGWFRNKMETEINLRMQGFLNSQIQQWANSQPMYKEMILSACAEVKNIQIKPVKISVDNGYITAVASCKADLSLRVD